MREDGYQDTGPRPRATCPACRASVPVRRNGALREHRPPGGHRDDQPCPGSGDPPAEAADA